MQQMKLSQIVKLFFKESIGGATVYAVYALLNRCMLGIHKFRPSQINFRSTKSLLSMIGLTTVMQLCSGLLDLQPASFSLVQWVWVNVLDYSVTTVEVCWFSVKSLKLLPPDVRFKAKMHQIRFRLGPRPRPRWGAYSAPPDTLAGFKGPTSKGGRGKEGERGRGDRGKGR